MNKVSSHPEKTIQELREELTDYASILEQTFRDNKTGEFDPEEMIPILTNTRTCAYQLMLKIQAEEPPVTNRAKAYLEAVNELWSVCGGIIQHEKYKERDLYNKNLIVKLKPSLRVYMRLK